MPHPVVPYLVGLFFLMAGALVFLTIAGIQ